MQHAYPHIDRAWLTSNILRSACNRANTTAAAAGGRGVAHPHAIQPFGAGGFKLQSRPVTTEGLYLNAERPPEVPDDTLVKPHHLCDVCASIKSHPVA
jgi:hypothetical protein